MPEVRQVQNLLLPQQMPPNLRAQQEAGQDAVQRASAPSAPYSSRAAGLLKALEGGLGGMMEGSAVNQAMQGQRAATAGAYNWLNTLQPGQGGSGTAPSPMNTPAPQPEGGIGSDRVAGLQGASHSAWLASIAPQAQRVAAQLGVDPRLVMAQAALESNYGRSAPGNNYFGIKGQGSGPVGTHEFVDGRMVPTQASFASYDSPDASFAGYGKLMSGPRYAGVRNAQGLDAQVAALGQSGYATDPNYAAKIGTIAKGIDPGMLQSAPAGPAGGPSSAAAASSAPAGSISDGAAMAAQNRLRAGAGTEADRVLYARYLQQQNTPQPGRTASADMPAPNAQPVGMQGLPPGVTPQMFAASQPGALNGNTLRRADEVPAGMQPYLPGQVQPPAGVTAPASSSPLADGLMAFKGAPSAPAGQGQPGPVTAGGVPHQLAPGAAARADNGVALGIGQTPGASAGAPPATDGPELDPEGTGAQNYAPGQEPTLRDQLTAAFAGQMPSGGQAQPAVTPDPAPLAPGDKVQPGGLVGQPAGPSTLPGPLPGPSGDVAQAPVVPPPQGSLTPPAAPQGDGSVRGDLMAAMQQHDPVGAGLAAGQDVALDPVVPDPQGTMMPPAPSSPNDALAGPQSDGAMGNGVPPVPSPNDALAGPQSDAAAGNGAPDTGPSIRDMLTAGFNAAPPDGPQSDAAAPLAVQPPAGAPLNPSQGRIAGADVGDPGLDAMRAGMVAQPPGAPAPSAPGPTAPPVGSAPSPAPAPGGTAPAAPAAASAATLPGSVDDFGRTTDQAMAPGAGAAQAGAQPTPPSASSAPPQPAMIDPRLPPPGPSPASGGDLSKLALGPLTPGYMAALGKALPSPDLPAPDARQAGPAPVAGSPVAAALQNYQPPQPPSPQALVAALGGSGTNAPAGNSPMSDPSSPQNFMRQQAAQAQGSGPTPGGFMAGIMGAGTPATPQGGTGLTSGIPGLGSILGGLGGGGAQQPPSAMPQGTPGQGAMGAPSAADGQPGGAPGYGASPAQAAAPGAGAPAMGSGGMTPEQRVQGIALLSSPYAAYLDPSLKEAMTARLFPQMKVEKLDNGDLYQIDPTGTMAPRLLAHGGKFDATKNGVIYNQGTGLGVDGQPVGGSSAYRPATAAERAQYGVTDDRPMYFGPGGQPTFGQPGTAGQGETEEAKKSGEAAAGRENDMLNAANAAPMKIARLDLIGKVLDNTRTGPLAGEAGTAAAIASQAGIAPERLAALGIDPNQAVNNAIANKLAGEMTMSSIGAKNGGMPASNFSVAERQFIEALYPNIENMPGANRMVIDVLKTNEQRNAQIAQEWGNYKDQQRASGKPLSYGDFEDSFRRAHAQDNAFAPIIQKYNAGGYTPTALSPNGMPNASSAGQGQAPAPQSAPPTASAAPPQWSGTPSAGTPPQGGQGAAGQAQGGPQGSQPVTAPDALAQARAALAKGAPRAAVLQRLQGMGINTVGL